MRVVAGFARGRILHAPEGRTTRPTSDRVREAVFSILTSMQRIEGATVLDLFAGSGALGIEALSRGAAHVTFVESGAEGVQTINANLEVVGEARSNTAVLRRDAVSYLRGASPVDVVLADPPYGFDGWADLLDLLSHKCALLVAETGSLWDPGTAWETMRVKRYGGTVVTVVQPLARPQDLVRVEGEV
jgi:16S rRNA (guanine966-N2)-methyltransferase